MTDDLSVDQVLGGERATQAVTRPGTAMAAVVLLGTSGGRETEQIAILNPTGTISDPIYGPEIVTEPAGNPRIVELSWSRDGSQLAVLLDDATVIVINADDPSSQTHVVAAGNRPVSIGWSPNGDAILQLLRSPDGLGSLRIIPLTADGFFDIAPVQSFGTASWISSTGSIVVTEDRSAGFNPDAGSIFTLSADGSNRRLLVSSGQFGPAVNIDRIVPSPNGSQIAFTVETPGETGVFRFRSLQVLEIATGVRRELDVAPGQSISDLWWFDGGLAWRTVDQDDGPEYDGAQPFLIQVSDIASGVTSTVFGTDGT